MAKGIPITFYEREKIETYLRMKKKKAWIARKLNRDYSVIKREIKRNKGEHTEYVAERAHYYAERRSRKTNIRKLDKLKCLELLNYVKEKLKEGWSPEQISGRIEEKNLFEVTISHESIYDWVYKTEEGKRYSKYLRRKQKKRIKRNSRKKQGSRAVLKERVSIHERPEVKGYGHWETDSMIFKDESILSVQYEKKSMFCRIHKCKDKSAIESEIALRNSINSLPQELWLSITRDNGTENALHHETKVQSYFCDPYSSWQKGGVENINGLVREYFPKKSNLNDITDLQIQTIEDKLNDRPRKKLNYLTPNEVITSAISKMGL